MESLLQEFIQGARQASSTIEALCRARLATDAGGTVTISDVDREVIGALANQPSSLGMTRIDTEGGELVAVDYVELHTEFIRFVLRAEPRAPTERERSMMTGVDAQTIPLRTRL